MTVFGYKGGKLYLYYYQTDNDKNIKKNLNDFLPNVNQIICQKLFELISMKLQKLQNLLICLIMPYN